MGASSEATASIRKSNDPVLSELLVIALTAYVLTGDRERFLAAGMNDYLGKPVQSEDLLRVLAKVLHRAS